MTFIIHHPNGTREQYINRYDENFSEEVSKIEKSYHECIEASTKTITITA